MKRKVYAIRIDPEVWQKARELGLNISRICENALKQEIERKTGLKRRGEEGFGSPGEIRTLVSGSRARYA